MTAIRVGIQIAQQHATYRQIRQAWQEVGISGANTQFNWDHFFRISIFLQYVNRLWCFVHLAGLRRWTSWIFEVMFRFSNSSIGVCADFYCTRRNLARE